MSPRKHQSLQPQDADLIGYRVVCDDENESSYTLRVADFKTYELNQTPEECARLANNTASEVRDSMKQRGEDPLRVRVVPITPI